MKLLSKRTIEKRGWMYEDVKDKKILSVVDKCDGSIISFIKFSNNKVRAKSKMSFISDQAVIAQKVYENNKNLQKFIQETIDLGKTPIFELVGYSNYIVLNYTVESELILLQVRDNKTGNYENLC